MDRHDIDAELSVPGARELIESTSAAHLAYVATDGTPRVAPIGFFWTGDEFVISTATTAPKVKALAAHPDVALAIDAGNTPGGAISLSVRGRADLGALLRLRCRTYAALPPGTRQAEQHDRLGLG